MKILGIMGSPRLKSNTDLLLDQALQGAQSAGADTEKIIIDKLDIKPCREYYGCLRDGNCVIRDDMNAIYPKLLEADGIIIASPIFFYNVPAQLKALIDRSQALWARRNVLHTLSPKKRRGVFIGVGATKGERLFEGSILTVKYFFKAFDVDYAGELLIRGVDQRGEIKDHPESLTAAFELGKKLALEIGGASS